MAEAAKEKTLSLLEKAKEVALVGPSPASPVSEEEVDLLIAYLQGELQTSQVEIALGMTRNSGGKIRNWMMRVIRTAWVNKRIGVLPKK